MSIVQKVAEWIAARPEGAISADVAAAFSLTVSEASRVIGGGEALLALHHQG